MVGKHNCAFFFKNKMHILWTGVGFKLLIAVADLDKCPKAFRVIIGISFSITVMAMLFIRLTHWKYIWYVYVNDINWFP